MFHVKHKTHMFTPSMVTKITNKIGNMRLIFSITQLFHVYLVYTRFFMFILGPLKDFVGLIATTLLLRNELL
jgi:hypothetical protein